MNRLPFLLLCLAIVLALGSPAPALSDKGRASFQRLKAALTEESAKGEGANRRDMSASAVAQLATLLEREEGRERALEVLSQISAIYSSDAVAAEVSTLQSELLASQKADDERVRTLIADNLQAARKAVEQAQAPADLDATLSTLGNLRKELASEFQTSKMRPAQEELNNAQRFVTLWQNYLVAKQAGNAPEAMESLRGLANSEGAALLPRSSILELLEKAKAAAKPAAPPEAEGVQGPAAYAELEKIAADTKSLDDLEGSMRRLREIRFGGQRNPDVSLAAQGFLMSLESINRSYQQYKAGLPVMVSMLPPESGGGGTGPGNAVSGPVLSRLTADLILLTLPRYVGAPPDATAKPGESPQQLLTRLFQEAEARRDYPGMMRAAEARRTVLRVGSFSRADTDGFTSLLAAQNQEAAGQFLLAVVSYQAALNTGSDLVPAKVIGERLDALKRDHPEDFNAGMERFFALRTLQPDPRQIPGPGNRPYMGPSGPFGPSGQDQSPQPALLIPPLPVGTNQTNMPKPVDSVPGTNN